MFGDHQPAAIPHLSVKTSPNHQLMVSLISPTFLPQKACHQPQDELAQVRFLPAFLPEVSQMGLVLFQHSWPKLPGRHHQRVPSNLHHHPRWVRLVISMPQMPAILLCCQDCELGQCPNEANILLPDLSGLQYSLQIGLRAENEHRL